jgi:glycerophosphoryl diester phosphodiesterase
LKPLIIAHRGAMTEAPENTRPAFDKAIAHRVDGIEFDVQITGDRQPVVFHDASLRKINGSVKSIADFTYTELRQYDWGGWFSRAFQNEPILTLEQVLTTYGPRTRLMIEIKPSPRRDVNSLYCELASIVVEQVRNLISKDRISQMYILSFDPELLKSAFFSDPDLNYVLNLDTSLIDQNCLNIDPAILCGYCLEHTHVNHRFVENVHEEGKLVMTYSCNRPETLEQLLDLSVDVIMTDEPGYGMWKEFDL